MQYQHKKEKVKQDKGQYKTYYEVDSTKNQDQMPRLKISESKINILKIL